MSTEVRAWPPEPGEVAPEFSLPAVNHEGTVSLADYRGRRTLFMALFRGLYCPFCRRHVAELGSTSDTLGTFGVDVLGVVATPLENARLYFRFRPARVLLAADPELRTHRAFGIPRTPLTPELAEALETLKLNPMGFLPEPMSIDEGSRFLNEKDGFRPTADDREDVERQHPQLMGQFLIDVEGVVRWSHVETRDEGLQGLGTFPSADEIVEALRGASLA